MLDLGMFIRDRLEKKGVKFVFSEKIKIQNYDFDTFVNNL